MLIRISEERCTGHGRCYTIADELLSCDDEGYVLQRGIPVEVRVDQVGVARSAVESCPEGAIVIVD